ncbi:MAG: glycosyltransferase [Flavobacteriales bacterium]|nr:glycosyltransferase [Flavobacteriales bacterium]
MINETLSVKPVISVIVPLYNVERYLATCIESIQNQTLKDIEIILVNDGSPDTSGEIAEAFAKKDNRIKVIHKNNGGLSSARNEGLLMAKGCYISFIDSDDWIDPTMLKDLYLAAQKGVADIVVSGVIVEYTKENSKVVDNVPANIINNNRDEFGNLFWELKKMKLSNYAWNKLYKTSFINNNELKFSVDSMPAEDLFFNLSAFKTAKSITVVNKAYYHYMKRDETSILSKYQKNLIIVEEQRKAAYMDFFNHFKMYGEEYSDFLNRMPINAGSGIVLNLFKNSAPFNRKERVSIISKYIYNSKEVQENIGSFDSKNLYEKIFIFLYRFTNPRLMELTYSVLFILRRRFIGLYLKMRKNGLR